MESEVESDLWSAATPNSSAAREGTSVSTHSMARSNSSSHVRHADGPRQSTGMRTRPGVTIGADECSRRSARLVDSLPGCWLLARDARTAAAFACAASSKHAHSASLANEGTTITDRPSTTAWVRVRRRAAASRVTSRHRAATDDSSRQADASSTTSTPALGATSASSAHVPAAASAPASAHTPAITMADGGSWILAAGCAEVVSWVLAAGWAKMARLRSEAWATKERKTRVASPASCRRRARSSVHTISINSPSSGSISDARRIASNGPCALAAAAASSASVAGGSPRRRSASGAMADSPRLAFRDLHCKARSHDGAVA